MTIHEGSREFKMPCHSSPGSWRLAVCFTCLAVVSGLFQTAHASLVLHTATGLRVSIHTAEDIVERWLVQKNGRTWLQHPTAGTLELDTERFPWSELVPTDAREVAAALSAMHGFSTDLQVEVFLLPGLPSDVLTSMARRQAIFMAPGLSRQHPETIAYVATHEMGHVLSWAALDGRPERWQAYRSIRGLQPQAGDLAMIPHAERHGEILAEDIRHLFGGQLATRLGTIENARLPLPDAVSGLAELLAGFFADLAWSTIHAATPSHVYPNPSRDLTRVELLVGDQVGKQLGSETILEIFDVRGRLVRRLAGGVHANGRLTVVWDGRLCDGRRAADGAYLYRIRDAGHAGHGRLLLLSP